MAKSHTDPRLSIYLDDLALREAIKIAAARALDRLRRKIGPIGVPACELIAKR